MSRRDEDFAREIEAHIALETARLVEGGMDRSAAQAEARRRFGNVTAARERFFESHRLVWLHDLRQDVRYALRSLRRSPGFAAVAILTLAIGIGANTAIFSIVDALLLRPLPYPDSGRLVRIVEHIDLPEGDGPPRTVTLPVSSVDLVQLRTLARGIDGIDGYGTSVEMRFDDDEQAEVVGARISREALTRLGARASVGRLFDERESLEMAPVAVVSRRLWQRHLGGRADALGRSLTVEGFTQLGFPRQQVTVIGVMDEAFSFPSGDIDFWLPFDLPRSVAPENRPNNLAWLAGGASLEAASEETSRVLGRLHAGDEFQSRFELISLHEDLVGGTRPTLRLLTFAAGLVLLVACANVANLLLARTTGRAREMTVRGALGAGRARLVRQVLTESTTLALIGGAVGVAIAVAGIYALRPMLHEYASRPGLFRRGMFRQVGVDALQTVSLPRLDEIAVDAGTLAFTGAVCLITAALFGVLPAIRLAGRRQMDGLRDGALAVVGGFGLLRRNAARSVLVVTQVAMAIVLLVGGGLVINSFARMVLAEKGYDTADLLVFEVRTPKRYFTHQTLPLFAERLAQELASVPAIRAAGYATTLPGSGMQMGIALRRRPGESLSGANVAGSPYYPALVQISPGFQRAMGVRLIAGRSFSPDIAGRRSVLINESLAKARFGAEDPVGRDVYLDLGPMGDGSGRDAPWRVLGVVGDVRLGGLDRDPIPQVFVDLRGWTWTQTDNVLFPYYFVVRTTGDTPRALAGIRAALRGLDALVVLDNVMTMERIVATTVARPRLYAMLLGLFGGSAALLAAIGIYGVMAYAVAQSTREIGVRLALGAPRATVMRLVLGRAALLASAGTAIGLGGAMATSQLLQGMVFGLTPLDAATYASVAGLFAGVAVAASYLPARRASRLDPLVALRSE